MSDETESTKPAPKAEKPDLKPAAVPRGKASAEGTLSGADDAQVYADIAETLLEQSAHPLRVVEVQRIARDGHTIVLVSCDQHADGTRARKALSAQIEDWAPWVNAKIGDYIALDQLYGGKQYSIDGVPYVDMPTMTFRLEKATDAGYKRIE